MVETKVIKVSEAIHKRLSKDKKHFEDTIGINFSFSSTINELYKIIDSYTKK